MSCLQRMVSQITMDMLRAFGIVHKFHRVGSCSCKDVIQQPCVISVRSELSPLTMLSPPLTVLSRQLWQQMSPVIASHGLLGANRQRCSHEVVGGAAYSRIPRRNYAQGHHSVTPRGLVSCFSHTQATCVLQSIPGVQGLREATFFG
eukprot:4871218-Heterocapsa_arctica.AAC.1